MNTPDKKIRMKNLAFIEYPFWAKGQHFLTVMEPTPDGKRQIAARIYKEYDKEKKQWIYTAKDKEGKELYPPENKLYSLKKKFIEQSLQITHPLVSSPIKEDHPKDKAIGQMQKESELKEGRNEKQNTAREIETVIEKVNNHAKGVVEPVHDFVGENERKEELSQLRQGKTKSKGIKIER